MDDTLLTNVLIDNNGAVDVEVLASLLRRIRKVVGVRALSSHPGSLDAHGAGHLATGLGSPEERRLVRKDTGEPFWFFRDTIEVDGKKIRVTLHTDREETAEEAARARVEEVARGE